jgi:MFS family permease
MTQTLAEAPVHTLDAFQNPNFRVYFIGQLISISGTWMQNLAQGYLVFQLTKSEAWLGIVACAAGLPILLMSPIAGVLVERFPRKTLMYFTSSTQMLFAFTLFALTYSQMLQVWHIVMMALLLGMTNAIDVPARWTFVSEVVGTEQLKSGIALNSILNSSGRVLGPTIAGLVLVRFGPALCFLLNAFSFLAVMLSLTLMKVPYAIPPSRTANPLQQLREGFAFMRNDRLIRTLLVLSGIGGAFVIPLIQLMPAYADRVLNSPDEGYAALSVAQGVGSVTAGVVISMLLARFGYQRLVPTTIALAAAFTVLLAFQVTVEAAIVVGFLVGLCMILQFIVVNTTLQVTVPNAFRGRVLALYTLSFTGVAPFGALVMGILANATSTPFAIALFGVIGGVLGVGVWWNYQREKVKG